jgi:hypothetical protein
VVSDRERLKRYCDPRGCDAFASTVGPSARRATEVVLDTPAGHEEHRPTADDVRLVVHELGHMIGLDHAHQGERCQVMLPDVALLGCGARGGRSVDTADHGRPVCGPFVTDVRRAAELYGGPGIPREFCVSPLSR